MQRLAPQNRVLHIEPFHPPLAWLKNSNAVLKREISNNVPSLREVRPNVFTYRPSYPYVPFNMRSGVSASLNSSLYRAELRALLRKFGVTKPWLWAFFAQSLSVLKLDFEYVIYDCADDYPPYFPHPVEKRFVQEIDQSLCRSADLVFVGSEPLRQKKAPFNRQTYIVNHAADISHFAKAADPATVVPADLESIPHPRIGFVGMMDGIRFDVDIIRRLSDNPEYQVVIVGDFVGELKVALPSRKNIHLLGMKPVAQLPSYLKGLDVCLMPYRVNEATRYIYPLKLHEYMATGLPIVSTDIPAVDSFRSLIYVAENTDEFIRLTARALEENDDKTAAARRRTAQEHTWENHVQHKIDLIHRNLLDRTSENSSRVSNGGAVYV
jgi:glycosyltransferase involved in cell wall biosynthesis